MGTTTVLTVFEYHSEIHDANWFMAHADCFQSEDSGRSGDLQEDLGYSKTSQPLTDQNLLTFYFVTVLLNLLFSSFFCLLIISFFIFVIGS